MNIAEHFTRAVEVLPEAVRIRLDADAPLDWGALGDAGLGADLGKAASGHRRLPELVEALVHRLIRDVGIVPADVATAADRQGAAIAWVHWVTIEADGESYQILNDRSGEAHTGVRPEAVAGYAALALELAAAIQDACARWMEAGEQYREMPEDGRSILAQCAVRIHGQLRIQPETISGHPTAASLARTLEYAWNTQSAEVRAALAGVRLSTARGARAPWRSYYAPASSHRLHACDVGEIRWLRALAERAGAANRTGANGRLGANGREAVAEELHGAVEPVVEVTGVGDHGALNLGSNPPSLIPEREVAELERAANHLQGAVRKRLGEAYGTGVGQALARFQNRQEVDDVRAEMESSNAGQGTPRWLEELAATVLLDTGAQTRDGFRTGSMRLEPGRDREGRYRGTEVETNAFGRLTPAGLVEQICMGLVFANDAWSGLTALQSAGKEGHWTLNEAEAGSRELAASERETLEAAQEIGHALDRIHRTYTDAHGERSPSALEQAAMAAEALRTVGPTIRTAAGWPGGAETPAARSPEDIARVAAFAEALHGQIRTIANRLIAGWIAEVQAYGEGRNA